MIFASIERPPRRTAVALAVLLAAACTADSAPPTSVIEGVVPSAARGGAPGAPTSAVVRFGNNDVGTAEFGPEHPSSHARDNIIPSAVVIRAGGTVTFQVQPPHRVAIYEPGIVPSDIRLIPGETLVDHVGPPGPPLIPAFYVDEPTGRLFIETAPAFGPSHDVQFQFDEPGRYLVICAVAPHFAAFNMYAWVEVR